MFCLELGDYIFEIVAIFVGRAKKNAHDELWVRIQKFGDQGGTEGIRMVGSSFIFLKLHILLLYQNSYVLSRGAWFSAGQSWYNKESRGYRITAIIFASQARDEGPTPSTRTNGIELM